MIKLNDYLYNGDTVLKILHNYSRDLHEEAVKNHNQIDIAHSNFLIQQIEILEHNEFLSSQARRIREFYKYMVREYPYLAFTFKGRIKSLIRSEQKFNGVIVERIYNHYVTYGTYPSVAELKNDLSYFGDLIAYRIVISLPRCHLAPGEDIEKREMELLYKIANEMPEFLEEHGSFSAVMTGNGSKKSTELNDNVKPYYKDYVQNPSQYGYQALHVHFYDNVARNNFEVQLRTKRMDDFAEIGPANHLGYEKRQEIERARRDIIPVGECVYFDEAIERGLLLQNIDLSSVDVNMFSAVNNNVVNDGCGLFRGRQITPFEHLSRFQNDIMD